MLSCITTDYFEFGSRNAEFGIKKGRNSILMSRFQHHILIDHYSNVFTIQLINHSTNLSALRYSTLMVARFFLIASDISHVSNRAEKLSKLHILDADDAIIDPVDG